MNAKTPLTPHQAASGAYLYAVPPCFLASFMMITESPGRIGAARSWSSNCVIARILTASRAPKPLGQAPCRFFVHAAITAAFPGEFLSEGFRTVLLVSSSLYVSIIPSQTQKVKSLLMPKFVFSA